MIEFELSSYNNAEQILQRRGLLQEIKDILRNVKRVDHKEIQNEFHKKDWEIEKQIFSQAIWAWDAYKGKVAASVELSLIDAVHRDFLRAILAQKHGNLDVLVYVTSTSKEPKFKNVKRDIEIFKEILHIPILLIGLTRHLLMGYTSVSVELSLYCD
jgi:hypothetical protein